MNRVQPAHELDRLQQYEVIDQLNQRERLHYAGRLLEIFGFQSAPYLSKTATPARTPIFDQMWRAYVEIQKRLSDGDGGYIEALCVQTKKVIDLCKSESRPAEQIFSSLKERSYLALAFPQKIFQYRNADFSANLKILERIERIRARGFSLLCGLLEESPEEVKGERLSPDDEIALTSLCHNGGAIMKEGGAIRLSRLVRIWAVKQSPGIDDRLAAAMSIRDLVQEEGKPLAIRAEQGRFKRFLAKVSVEAIEKNLGLRFFAPFAHAMILLFEENESIRSDCSYFSADLQFLYQMDLDKFKRPSAHLIRSFQILFFMIRHYGLREADRPFFLMMIYYRNPSWKEKDLEEFERRRWGDPGPDAPHDDLTQGWSLHSDLLNQLSRGQAGDGSLLRDRWCWPLFVHLWRHDHREQIFRLFHQLISEGQLSLTLEMLYKFCMKNSGALTPDRIGFFVEQYLKVLELLKSPDLGAALFLHPPIELVKEMHHIGRAVERCTKFMSGMDRFGFSKNREYMVMLRHFILHPQEEILRLLGKVAELGIRTFNQEMIYNALSVVHPEMGEVIPEELHVRASQTIKRINAIYRFTESETFFLYLEVVRLMKRDGEDEIGRMSQFIEELRAFCPSIQKKDIYFLFLHHPKVVPRQVEEFVFLRHKWAQHKQLWSRLTIGATSLAENLEPIEACVQALSGQCESEAVEQFKATFRASLIGSLFPPWQPLVNPLEIADLTEAGIEWMDATKKVRLLGQFQVVLNNASVHIYTHWIELDRPLFFFSFFDIRKNIAKSAFIPFDLPPQVGKEQRGVFFKFLGGLAQLAFRSEASEAAEEVPDEPGPWMRSCQGMETLLSQFTKEIAEGILSPDRMNKIWEFIREVKISYLDLFLQTVETLPNLFPKFNVKIVAGSGHIFPAYSRGSLLPESLLQFESEPRFFFPDAEDSFINACAPRFKEPTPQMALLDLDLQVAGENGPVVHPIYYRVQTVQDLTGEKGDAAQEGEAYRYVTLGVEFKHICIPLKYPLKADLTLFRKLFDYHNLLLKAHIYRAMHQWRD